MNSKSDEIECKKKKLKIKILNLKRTKNIEITQINMSNPSSESCIPLNPTTLYFLFNYMATSYIILFLYKKQLFFF
jgi:hypothetical protein